MSVPQSKPHTAAPLSSAKHRRAGDSSKSPVTSVNVTCSSPVLHTPGQVHELAKRFSYPSSPTTPTGSNSKNTPSKIPVPSAQKTPMKATGSAAGMMKSGIPVPKQMSESPTARDDRSTVVMQRREGAAKSNRTRPMSWDSSLIFNPETLTAESSKEGGNQSFNRSSNASPTQEVSPESAVNKEDLEGQLATSTKVISKNSSQENKNRLSVRERTRRWEQRGGGVPSYFATLPRPPKKQYVTERCDVRQSSVPPSDTAEDGLNKDMPRERYSVSGVPHPVSTTKIPSPITSATRAGESHEHEVNVPQPNQDGTAGSSNSNEPMGEGSAVDSLGIDSKARSLSVTEYGGSTSPGHPPIIKRKGLSVTVGRARGQHLLPTKTQIHASTSLPVSYL